MCVSTCTPPLELMVKVSMAGILSHKSFLWKVLFDFIPRYLHALFFNKDLGKQFLESRGFTSDLMRLQSAIVAVEVANVGV